MSTHNICFRGEIRKILTGYPLLSVAMYIVDLYHFEAHSLGLHCLLRPVCPSS